MLKGWRASILPFLISFVLVAADALVPVATAAAATWELGHKRFLTTGSSAAPPLRLQSAGREGLTSFRFLGRVGGVALEAVAKPVPDLAGKPIELSYDATRPDGTRLVVRIGTQVLRTNVPDWQLRPIALFADSEYTATLSLFGEGPESRKYYYIQYHEALKDPLLGMRILQADILFFSLDDHWRLPKYDGQIILGRGEQNSNETQSRQAALRISAVSGARNFALGF